MIDHAELKRLLSYDRETGSFTWNVDVMTGRYGAQYAARKGQLAGNRHSQYRSISVQGHRLLQHRLAWFYVYGTWPTRHIIHINGDTSDNRIANLRDASSSVLRGGLSTIDRDELRRLFSYSGDSGLFTRRVDAGQRHKAGEIAGTIKNTGHIGIKVGVRIYSAHRLAWLYVYGEWPKQHIDHINGNPADNRIANLRDVSVKVNSQNRRTATPGKKSCGLLGVTRDGKGRWQASIKTGNKSHYLGKFATPEAAHDAYVKAKRELHAGCTI